MIDNIIKFSKKLIICMLMCGVIGIIIVIVKTFGIVLTTIIGIIIVVILCIICKHIPNPSQYKRTNDYGFLWDQEHEIPYKYDDEAKLNNANFPGCDGPDDDPSYDSSW